MNRGFHRSAIHLGGQIVRASKEKAEYSSYALYEKCEACVMFIPTDGVTRNGISEEPTGDCTKVKGNISPAGHCRFWEGKD